MSVLRRLVKVIVNLENDEKEIREYMADELKFKPRRKKQKVTKEEMRRGKKRFFFRASDWMICSLTVLN